MKTKRDVGEIIIFVTWIILALSSVWGSFGMLFTEHNAGNFGWASFYLIFGLCGLKLIFYICKRFFNETEEKKEEPEKPKSQIINESKKDEEIPTLTVKPGNDCSECTIEVHNIND